VCTYRLAEAASSRGSKLNGKLGPVSTVLNSSTNVVFADAEIMARMPEAPEATPARCSHTVRTKVVGLQEA
jgi:hypothetical protein